MEQTKKPTSTSKHYQFLTDTISFHTVETKSTKKHFVTGYISTDEIDLDNDLVTKAAMQSMLKQLKSSTIMLDYDHEFYLEDSTRIPVGKIVDAKLDDRGLWVKAELNKASPKFQNMWDSIKEGFISAFSIAFQGVKSVKKLIADTEVRVISDLQLLNVALTGVPVNRSAVMTDFGMKSVMLKALKDVETSEENKVTEEKDKPVEEKPKEEVKDEVEEKPKEETKTEDKPKEEVKDKPADEPAKETPETKALTEDLTKQLKSLTEKVEAQEKEIKEFKEKGVFKSQTPEPPKKDDVDIKSVNVIDAIK